MYKKPNPFYRLCALHQDQENFFTDCIIFQKNMPIISLLSSLDFFNKVNNIHVQNKEFLSNYDF